ncbi:MAG: SpoIIE family protein phosphatase [Acidobacteria bacterium]|nr:SpoIIE family protein phosphatase [Acidobacteriota bacterium]
MARLRLPERVSAGRRDAPLLPAPPVEAVPRVTARDLLLRSWPGRIFLVSAALKAVAAVLRQTPAPPVFDDVLSTLAAAGLAVSLTYFLWRIFILMKRQLLWRVRRKLIISYIFIGVVPAILIIGFFLLAAGMVSMNVSVYLFRVGYEAMVDDIALLAQSAASEIGRDPKTLQDTLRRYQQAVQERYPEVSLAFLPAPRSTRQPIVVGAWEHLDPPKTLPQWLPVEGFKGSIALPVGDGSDEVRLIIRAVRQARGAAGTGHVIVDLVMDDHMLDSLYERTSVKGRSAWLSGGGAQTSPAATAALAAQGVEGRWVLFRNSVTFLDCTTWAESGTREDRQVAIATTYNLSELWGRLTGAQSVRLGGASFSQLLMFVFAFLIVLFLIIQGVALLMGLALARSITSAIHELFMGTERVQNGDFGHRIQVVSNDQLGELAQSFNQMTGSIEGLLLTAAEKKRLDEELRIARQIQMSLLPRGPLDLPGIGVTALCVPAREVGGDYYDFFHLADDRIGVLIADVAGKGTSAALYMAELKGLVLALSQTQRSPRDMLIEVNRIISDNLDSRSFITMTYAVIDRRAGVMTYCRAGHTPMIYLPAASPATAQVLIPDGMVVGLRIPGAAEKFSDHLEEHRIDLAAGDVIALYTDGITEAMNAAGDLFSDARLARIVEEHGHLSSGELRERILREIEAFVGGADQHDDMTMILLKVEHSFTLEAVGVAS